MSNNVLLPILVQFRGISISIDIDDPGLYQYCIENKISGPFLQ